MGGRLSWRPCRASLCSLLDSLPRTDCANACPMKDMLAHLEKLRVQIAECELIRDLATDSVKRELFNRLAEHYKVLAGEVERAIAASKKS